MQQVSDFFEESETLFALLDTLSESDFERPTQFKNWTTNDVLVHLQFWSKAADLSLVDPDAFTSLFAELHDALKSGNLREFENARIKERGSELVSLWREFYTDMTSRWASVDPKTRVKWAGPDMSVRSSITARQMETWSHGQEVFDLFAEERAEGDRIRNVVVLGVNTFGWTFMVNKMEPPSQMPFLNLQSPSGAIWNYGEETASSSITGNAVEFCQVVAQTRNIADTRLKVEGEVAQLWMQYAQCFAGAPETPPEPGARAKS